MLSPGCRKWQLIYPNFIYTASLVSNDFLYKPQRRDSKERMIRTSAGDEPEHDLGRQAGVHRARRLFFVNDAEAK